MMMSSSISTPAARAKSAMNADTKSLMGNEPFSFASVSKISTLTSIEVSIAISEMSFKSLSPRYLSEAIFALTASFAALYLSEKPMTKSVSETPTAKGSIAAEKSMRNVLRSILTKLFSGLSSTNSSPRFISGATIARTAEMSVLAKLIVRLSELRLMPASAFPRSSETVPRRSAAPSVLSAVSVAVSASLLSSLPPAKSWRSVARPRFSIITWTSFMGPTFASTYKSSLISVMPKTLALGSSLTSS